jgi:hypothetical protein
MCSSQPPGEGKRARGRVSSVEFAWSFAWIASSVRLVSSVEGIVRPGQRQRVLACVFVEIWLEGAGEGGD